MVALLALAVAVLLSCSKGGGKSSGNENPAASDTLKPASAEIAAEVGGSVTIKDAASVQIPAGALPSTTTVKVASADEAGLPGQFGGAQAVGRAIAFDLGGASLSKPATLEVAFDPKSLPPSTPKNAVFLAYYDTVKQTLVPVGGQVDEQRNVVAVQADRSLSWKPWTWNWDAWIVVMKGALSLRVSDFVKGIGTLTEPCEESTAPFTANNVGGNSIIKGCVTRADAARGELRVVNLKSFPIGVRRAPGSPTITSLASGDSLRFAIETGDSQQGPPHVVSAHFSQPIMNEFVVSLVARMLPAGDLLKSEGITFIAEGLGQVWDNKEISDALASGKAGEAATKLVQAITQDAFVQRFVELAARYGQEHGFPMLTKWTVEGAKKALVAVAAVDVIFTATDFVANYFFNNTSSVTFQWTRPCPSPQAGDYARLPNGAINVYVTQPMHQLWVYPPERAGQAASLLQRDVGQTCTQEINKRYGFRIAPEPMSTPQPRVTRGPITVSLSYGSSQYQIQITEIVVSETFPVNANRTIPSNNGAFVVIEFEVANTGSNKSYCLDFFDFRLYDGRGREINRLIAYDSNSDWYNLRKYGVNVNRTQETCPQPGASIKFAAAFDALTTAQDLEIVLRRGVKEL